MKSRPRSKKTRFFMKKSDRFIGSTESILKEMTKMSQNGQGLPGILLMKNHKKFKMWIRVDLFTTLEPIKPRVGPTSNCLPALRPSNKSNHALDLSLTVFPRYDPQTTQTMCWISLNLFFWGTNQTRPKHWQLLYHEINNKPYGAALAKVHVI